MKPEIEAVLRLQSLDDRTTILQKEIAELPKHVADIERKLEVHTGGSTTTAMRFRRTRRSGRASRTTSRCIRGRCRSSATRCCRPKNNEQYRAFQHEITWCETEIRKCEDQILDLMGEGEPLEKNVKAAEKALAEEKKKSRKRRSARECARPRIRRSSRGFSTNARP